MESNSPKVSVRAARDSPRSTYYNKESNYELLLSETRALESYLEEFRQILELRIGQLSHLKLKF